MVEWKDSTVVAVLVTFLVDEKAFERVDWKDVQWDDSKAV